MSGNKKQINQINKKNGEAKAKAITLYSTKNQINVANYFNRSCKGVVIHII